MKDTKDTTVTNISVVVYVENYRQYVRLDDGINEEVYQIYNEIDLAVLVSRFAAKSYTENINIISSKQYVIRDEDSLEDSL